MTPQLGRYYVAVDSGRELVHGPLAGRQLRALVLAERRAAAAAQAVMTARVAAGRPTLALRVFDVGSSLFDPGAGVDPLSLVISYGNVLVGAAAYDPVSGLALFPLPSRRSRRCARPARDAGLRPRPTSRSRRTSNTTGADMMPNTVVRGGTLQVVDGPAATWLTPGRARLRSPPAPTSSCWRARRRRSARCASSTASSSSRSTEPARPVSTRRSGARAARRGRPHAPRDRQGREGPPGRAQRVARVCR